ncbi:hypothetical protein HDU88_000898 [Geranomyces variabilis]|nr:hypothetical protein HDU88_000898 [Geranomyces variabilis]
MAEASSTLPDAGTAMTLQNFPNELLLRIADYLPFRPFSPDGNHLRRPDLISLARLRSVCRAFTIALPVDALAAILRRYLDHMQANGKAFIRAWNTDERFLSLQCYCYPRREDYPSWGPADPARPDPDAMDLYANDGSAYKRCPAHAGSGNTEFGRVVFWRFNVPVAAMQSCSVNVLLAFEKAGLWQVEKLLEVIPDAAVAIGRDLVYRQEVAAMASRVVKSASKPTNLTSTWSDACCIALKRRDFELAEFYAATLLAASAAASCTIDSRGKLGLLTAHIYRAGWEKGHELLWDKLLSAAVFPLDQSHEAFSIAHCPLFGLGQGGHVGFVTEMLRYEAWTVLDLVAGVSGAAVSGNVQIARLYLDQLQSMVDQTEAVALLNTRHTYAMQGNPNIGFSDKFTVLEMSSWCGHLQVVDALSRYPGIKLSRGRPGPDYRDMGLFTALSLAASVGHIEIVRLLLARGANPRVHDNKALSCAVYAGHFAIAALLLEAGCDINLVIEEGMANPMTLLSQACGGQGDRVYLDAIHFCRSHGATVSCDDVSNLTNDGDCVEALDALLDPRSPCEGPTTVVPFELRNTYTTGDGGPLTCAVRYGIPAVVRKLLDMGANVAIEGPGALASLAQRFKDRALGYSYEWGEGEQGMRRECAEMIVDAGEDLKEQGLEALRDMFEKEKVEELVVRNRIARVRLRKEPAA